MAFNCYFLGGVDKFVMDGHTITGLDAQGQEVFSHTYKLLDEENENGFIFYQSEDKGSGQFTYFAFSPDTMETTYHLEFRYAEDLSDLQSWFEGNYAYWNAAAIAENYDQATWKMSLSCSPQKICRMQNNCSLRTRLDQAGAHTVFQMRM